MSTTVSIPTSIEPGAGARARRRPAVIVDHVSKTFRIPHQQYSTLKERALHPLRRTTFDELRAVRDVTIEVAQGEFFGIVGRNGSGKSTLLKCIAGIYNVDRGRILVAGRLSPFIELGVGFNPDLNARDNVIINAIILGLSRKEAMARFERVVDFAELHDFMDLRLKNYSSGMMVRLAFATAIQVDADVLLIDEVLAVGDAAFQQKCFEQFFRLKREGKTIVFVSHDMHSVERFCDRAMLMEHGRVIQLGEPRMVARAYHEMNFGKLAHEAPAQGDGGGTAAARIVDAWFEDAKGERVSAASQEEQLALCFEVAFGQDVEEPIFAATLRTELGHTIIVARSDQHDERTESYRSGERAIARFAIPNWLTPSRYLLTPSLASAGTGEKALALVEDMASIVIHGSTVTGGILEPPVDLSVERI
jgi:ABC-type polysaccharide/polyol phosphate transport system ATPase subunit